LSLAKERKKMKESDLNFFIDSTLEFFRTTTSKEVEIGVPYLKDKDPIVLDYTGIIRISGEQKGSIYFTASRDMLIELGSYILEDIDYGEDELKDLVEEIVNTIAGSVRGAYGSSFLISVPAVIEGMPKDICFPENLTGYVIPIVWQDYKAFLVVCLE
jgi:chemotaxis protein CheX